MKRIDGLVVVFALLLATLELAPGQVRTFSSLSGQKISAELVSHRNMEVTLRREDGRQVKIPVAAFSVDDQLYIKDWMAKTPETVSYSLRIGAEKKRVEGGSVDQPYYKKVKNEKWSYLVKVTNMSRDTVSSLSVKYRVFYSNRADGEFSADTKDVSNQAMLEDEVKLEQELRYNQTMEFMTKPVSIDKVDYDYGPRYKDSLRGVMVRVLDPAGQVAADWVSPTTSLANQTWESMDPGAKTKPTVTVRGGARK